MSEMREKDVKEQENQEQKLDETENKMEEITFQVNPKVARIVRGVGKVAKKGAVVLFGAGLAFVGYKAGFKKGKNLNNVAASLTEAIQGATNEMKNDPELNDLTQMETETPIETGTF